SEIKEIESVLDVEPAIIPEVLQLTRWVADYYAAPLGEVMRAALPAGINTSIMQVVAITAKGRKLVNGNGLSNVTSAQGKALRLLADEGDAEINAFNLRMGSTRTPKWLRELEHEQLIERTYRTRTTATRAKRRRAVRLIKDGYAGVSPAGSLVEQARRSNEQPGRRTPRETDAQRRVIEILRAGGNEMAVSELVAAAKVSESVIATLKKRGVVDEFEQEMRRDPLARAELPETEQLK